MHVIARPAPVALPWVLVGSGVLGSMFMVAEPHYWALGLLIGCFGVMWTVVTGNDMCDPLELDKLYLGFFALYCVLPFVLAALYPERLDTSVLDAATILCVTLAMLGTILGSRMDLSRRLERAVARFDQAWNVREAVLVGSAMLGIGGGLLALLFMQVGLGAYLQSEYVNSYAAELGKGYLSAGIFLVRIGILVLLLALLEYRRRLPWVPLAMFAVLCLFYLRVGRRGVVLSAGIALLMILHFYYKPFRYRTLITLALVGVVLFMAVAHARAYSAGGLEGMISGLRDEFVLEDAWLTMQEVNTIPLSLYEMTQYIPNHASYLYGRSYWEAFEILVPLELHPNRPLGSSQWFAWYYNPRVAAMGGGYAFSLIAEGYINFGMLGAFLVGLVQGAFLKTMVQLRRNNPLSKSRLLVYATIGMQIYFLIRGDFGALVKLGFIIGVPTLAIAMFLGRAPKRTAQPMLARMAR
jgi:oligosaccharide repeat unit polymerase